MKIPTYTILFLAVVSPLALGSENHHKKTNHSELWWEEKFSDLISHLPKKTLEELGHEFQEEGTIKKAIQYYCLAASKGSISALYQLSLLNDRGIEKELNPFKRLESNFSTDILLGLGLKYDLASNMEKAIKFYKRAAQYESPLALYNLGVLYDEGIKVPADHTKAADYFKRSAKLGLPYAQFKLAVYYENGKGGIKKNLKTAQQWYEKAAQQNLPEALCNLGYFLLDGLGGKKDYQKAKTYFSRSADLDFPQALNQMGNLMMDENEDEKAFQYYKRAAEGCNAMGCYNTGVSYAMGKGTAVDLVAAKKYFERTLEIKSDFIEAKKALKELEKECIKRSQTDKN